MPHSTSDSPLLTVGQVSHILNIPKSRLYGLLRDGQVPGLVRIGRRLRVTRSVLEEFLRAGGRGLDRPADSARRPAQAPQ